MRLSSSIAVCAATIVVSAPAAAQSANECSPAYTQTQVLRKKGDLLGARAQALLCGAPACKYESADCTQWLTELDTAIPTVVFALKDADGRDIIDARVTIDGAPALERLDGKAIPLNPGPHVIRFEIPGQPPLEEKLLLREGERLRTVTGQLRPREKPGSPQRQPATQPTSLPAADAAGRDGIPAWAWIAGGVGIASTAVGMVFFVAQFGGQSEIDDNCSQQPPKAGYSAVECDDLRVDNNVRQGLAGGFLGAGVIGIGAAIFGIATSSSRPAATGFRGVVPTMAAGPGRVRAALSGSF